MYAYYNTTNPKRTSYPKDALKLYQFEEPVLIDEYMDGRCVYAYSAILYNEPLDEEVVAAADLTESWITIDRDSVRRMCIREDYFTCGNNLQYERMFRMVDAGCPLSEIAFVISFCSENADRYTVLDQIVHYWIERMRRLED